MQNTPRNPSRFVACAALDERLQQEVGESLGSGLLVVRLLQFLPGSPDLARYPCNGSGPHEPHMESGGPAGLAFRRLGRLRILNSKTAEQIPDAICKKPLSFLAKLLVISEGPKVSVQRYEVVPERILWRLRKGFGRRCIAHELVIGAIRYCEISQPIGLKRLRFGGALIEVGARKYVMNFKRLRLGAYQFPIRQ